MLNWASWRNSVHYVIDFLTRVLLLIVTKIRQLKEGVTWYKNQPKVLLYHFILYFKWRLHFYNLILRTSTVCSQGGSCHLGACVVHLSTCWKWFDFLYFSVSVPTHKHEYPLNTICLLFFHFCMVFDLLLLLHLKKKKHTKSVSKGATCDFWKQYIVHRQWNYNCKRFSTFQTMRIWPNKWENHSLSREYCKV